MDSRKLIGTVIAVLTCLAVAACREKPRDAYILEGVPPDITFRGGTPVWRGLVIGQATYEDTIAVLGTPERVWRSGDLEVWRYLPAGYRRQPYDFYDYYRLFFQNGILRVVNIQTWGVDYKGFRTQLGNSGQPAQPEKLIEYKSQGNVAVFASRGITAVLSRDVPDLYVDQLQYYAPMPVEEYLDSWGRFHPTQMPWSSPIPERVDALGFVPGQTRRSDVEAVLAPPDFERAEPQSGTQIVYYHAPGRGPSDLHRFDFRNGVLVWMDVKIWQQDYTIESAVARLGRVGVVARARFADVIPLLQYYFWPEQGIVLVARMGEISTPIETEAAFQSGDAEVRPNGADVVIAYVQFEPISLDLSQCAVIANKLNEELPAVVLP